MDVAAPHQCHRETGTRVNSGLADEAPDSRHVLSRRRGALGEHREGRDGNCISRSLYTPRRSMGMHVRLHRGELLHPNLHLADCCCWDRIKPDAISSPNVRFLSLSLLSVKACFACAGTSATARLHSCCIGSTARRTPRQPGRVCRMHSFTLCNYQIKKKDQ